MTYKELQQAIKQYEPALLFEKVFSAHIRKNLNRVFLLAILGFLLASVFSNQSRVYFGAFLLSISFFLLLSVLQAFYYSYSFRGLDFIRKDGKGVSDANEDGVVFEVAEIVSKTGDADLTKGFLKSAIGRMILLRCGVGAADVQIFLSNRKKILMADAFEISCTDKEGGISVFDYASAILKCDLEFSDFLFAKQIQPEEFLGTVEWEEQTLRAARLAERWWSRENLAQIEGIAKDWAYADTYILQKFGLDIVSTKHVALMTSKQIGAEESEMIERILSRRREANVLLVGDDALQKKEVLDVFAANIRDGKVLPELIGKRIVEINTTLLVSSAGEKTVLETTLSRIFFDAVKGGNVILVFPDLPAFISSASTLGADIVGVLGSYLASPSVQVIALSDPGPFHAVIESNQALMAHFEKIILKPADTKSILFALTDQTLSLEARNGVFFTYPALLTIVDGAGRYFSGGSAYDKALDIMFEMVPKAVRAKKRFIEKKDVSALLASMTGIPVGEVTEVEKEKLTDLENILNKRVIGQSEAVEAISNAMRRSRAGIGNKDRPLGSFLFLGPTGVGKTETTKALTDAFFGSDSKILRLDMSEYKTANALQRLIGSFEGGKSGVLSSMLRENPYGVLLLDEFEKTTKDVQDLFLQILDEGFFSDMLGKKVNARNLIIIATSNAGSGTIFETVQLGKKLSDTKDAIIEEIVSQNIFKPELLNRFDGVILFHPLGETELKQIAKLMLAKLQVRLRAQGINLVVNDALIKVLLAAGVDPKFGARPMNRAIQENVEKIFAKKIIAGEIKPGATVELSEKELGTQVV